LGVALQVDWAHVGASAGTRSRTVVGRASRSAVICCGSTTRAGCGGKARRASAARCLDPGPLGNQRPGYGASGFSGGSLIPTSPATRIRSGSTFLGRPVERRWTAGTSCPSVIDSSFDPDFELGAGDSAAAWMSTGHRVSLSRPQLGELFDHFDPAAGWRVGVVLGLVAAHPLANDVEIPRVGFARHAAVDA
jgi:hypothetical protein